MDNKSKRDNSDDTNKQENVPSSSQFKAMFKELLDEAKGDILSQVKENIDQIYADFESVAIDDEETSSCTVASDPGITDKIANFVQLPEQSIAAEAGPSDDGSFQNLAAEFSVAEQFSPAITPGLADIVNSLLKDKLPKEKLAEVQAKYTRPENCPNLVSPKVNKQIWQQMRQETRNTDSSLQKTQSLLVSGLCAVLEVCNIAVEDQKCKLAHAAVLLLAANREVNMRRRDLIRPDLNKQFSSLCNPSIAISAYHFGDDLNKEVEELTKSNKLSGKVTPKHRSDYRPAPYKIPFGRGTRGRGRFNQPSGRGRGARPYTSFLGVGRGQSRPPPNSRTPTSKGQ